MLASLVVAAALAGPVDSVINRPEAPVEVRLHAEIGFLAPLYHVIQFGQDGTLLDYVAVGGQDNLFPYTRWSGDLYLGRERRNIVTLLYQPLDLRTSVYLQRDLVVTDETFTEGTPMELRYGFSFWRGSWMYDVLPADDHELGLGVSLQIRNATIDFTSADGEQRRSFRDIGPVPVLKARWRKDFDGHWFLGSEIDGFYAPISYLNGDDNDVVGAIVDWSVRGGTELLRGTETFLAVRWIGGGSVGTSDDPTYGDGYTRNWLHFGTVSLGATLR